MSTKLKQTAVRIEPELHERLQAQADADARPLSDMTNLARAKDAAAEICDRGPPRRDRRRFHWKIERSAPTMENSNAA